MLEQHIGRMVEAALGHSPTPSQQKVINGIGHFIASPDAENIFLIKGFAGTGKTTLTSALVRTLTEMQISCVLLAPTGRAAKVFSAYAGQPAYTIHKKIYRQQSAGGAFQLNWNKHKDTLFLVDEASMIANASQELSVFGSGRLLEDLFQYIHQGSNCKLMMIGDTAQLPPIGYTESPALDPQLLESMGMKVESYILTDVVRQSVNSGILHNANRLRQAIEAIESNVSLPRFATQPFTDFIRLSGADLIEEINTCYDKLGMEDTMVICRSNKRANIYNKGIRASVLYCEEELTPGDLLMVVKNNYFWLQESKELDFIANGDIVEVVKIRKHEELYGFRFVNATVRFLDHGLLETDVKLMLNTLTSEGPGLTSQDQQHLFEAVKEDFSEETNKRKQWEQIKQNPYFNALQVKFAYAVTCHKAQGGQWKAVFIDQGMVNDEDKGLDYMRWLYTAFTRATEKLYLVNFPDNQFE